MTSLDGEALLRINRTVERFEDACRRGDPESLEDLLRSELEPLARRELLEYALAVELEFRRRRGESPSLEEYERRFPAEVEAVRGNFSDQETVTVPPSITAATVSATPTPPPRRGSGLPVRLGRYEVRGQLGGGGQGAAFLASDPDLGRQVVLKRYHATGDDAAREAKALCRVRSPYTAQCHDLMRLGCELFLIMEYIPGRTLSEVLKAGLLAPDVAVRLAEQVARGLEAVHACGLLHRDVKPSNVIVDDDGNARLVDFGLAAHLGSVELDVLSGSPPYMAPEQARRQSERIDARTDLYGVGGLLYAMLTGQPPHPGKTHKEILEHAQRGEITRPRSLVGSIPRPLERIILKALAADPARRHASASELRQSLHRYRWGQRLAPMMVGLLVVLAFVVPTWTLWPRATPSDQNRSRSATTGLPSPLQVTRFEIFHYPKHQEDGYDLTRVGLLGRKSFTTRVEDDLSVQAELSEPAYSYLIAYRTDGTDEICDPIDEDTPPLRKPHPQYPPPSQSDDYYRLSEGAGMHAFALVVSRAPLPSYREWKQRHGPVPWAARQPCIPGVVWRDDLQGLQPLLADDSPRNRAKGAKARGSGEPTARLARWLRNLPGVDLVALQAFPVEPAATP